VAVGGRVATGKTTVAGRLAALLGAEHVGADDVRAEVEASGLVAFTRLFEAAVYARLLRRADEALAPGHSVVLDGCFALAVERAEARALALRHGAPFSFVECRARPETLRARLAERDTRTPGWQTIADDVVARFEPVTGLAPEQHQVVSTDEASDAALAAIVARIRRRRDAAVHPAAVTFDCWNTLIYEGDWPTAHALRVMRLADAAREAGRPVSREQATRAFDVAWARHQAVWRAGEASGAREIARWGLAELGVEGGHAVLERLVAAFEEASHTGRVAALDGAHETLAALARGGIPCALVCDTGLTPGRVVRRHLDDLGLLQGLAVHVFSDEIGVPKPDPRMFRAALVPLGVAPEHALHVGDLRHTDVAGARGLGMRSVRIRDRHDDEEPLPEADFVVSSHAELRALLGL